MRRTPVTLGVLSMIFGSLVAFFSLVQLGLSAAGPMLTEKVQQLQEARHDPKAQALKPMLDKEQQTLRELRPYNDGLVGGKLLLSVVLIAVGAGMYKRRRWSRSGALTWSALALLFLVGELLVRITIIQPRTKAIVAEMMAQAPNPALRALPDAQGAIAIILLLALFAPYPLVLLALCGRSSAAGDFTD